MPVLDRLDAAHLRKVMVAYRDALRAHRERLDLLNVYPVPDGDTGKNMSQTVESVVKDLDGVDDDMASVCQAISHGALMGSAGNSGVILGQILRSATAVWREADVIGPTEVARGLAAAAEAAYKAVQNPVEGTILTVLRRSAEAIAERDGEALGTVLERARAAADEALEDTPNLLPKLADAGVVDAGGAGYVLLLDAALAVVAERPVPNPPQTSAPKGVDRGPEIDHGHGHGDVSDLRYEVMYFLEAPDEAIDSFKEVWATVGDSIVVVGGDGMWNCHIHTDDIGAAIEAGIECGRPVRIRVTDLLEQVEEERWVREAEETLPPPAEPVRTAVVAVCNGTGQQRLFRSLRVQSLVIGGQTMNPSTQDLVAAIEAAPSDDVIVLPNNKNIVAAAEQAAEVSSKRVEVLATSSVQEGLAALLEYDPESDAEANVAAMGECAGLVLACEVTRAVRDSSSPAGEVKEGDWIGLSREGIHAVADDVASAATGLLGTLLTDDHGIVTILEGEGSSAAATRTITQWLRDHHPMVQAEVQAGGQPHYPYLFGIE